MEESVEEVANALGVEAKQVEHLRLHFWHIWKVVKEATEDPSLLDEWRRAPRGSIGWRNLIFYEQALRVLEISD